LTGLLFCTMVMGFGYYGTKNRDGVPNRKKTKKKKNINIQKKRQGNTPKTKKVKTITKKER